MDKSIELPPPWYWTDIGLTVQLESEISKTHILYGRTTKTLARRQDNDDVLFLVDNEKFAVVHLTWVLKRLSDDQWPTTQFFDNWDDLYNKRILKDKEEFE
ncbi:hypothetical protein [Ohtaekwangia koreensis]|uniref:hypothetical protein n=1 Tax=Ohtaekwangia koreensis TaxID=688867 RepID=UPI0013564A0A|nr:hypothetical protein [Ohtaekwangia koreensis]